MKSAVKLSVWVLILIPVVLLLIIVHRTSATLFFADDFHLLKTIVWAQETDSFIEKFRLLAQQHNEHRIIIPRLLTWLNYKLVGHIDWPALMLFGNLLWCGVLYFLWDAFRTLKLNLWYFLPIPWLLLQPTYYDNYNWTISVLQQSVIVFLLAWMVHAFTNRRFLLAVFIFLIGTFTHGNGIFGIVVGVAFLLLYRDWKWLWIWLSVCLATAAIYFYGFEKGQNADFLQSLTHPVQLIGYFFAFFGASAELFSLGFVPTVLWGIIVFGGVMAFGIPKIYTHFRTEQPLGYFEKMLLGNLIFLTITALLVAVSRSWSSPDLDIPPRNAHYSPYLTAWFYLVGLAVLSRVAAKSWAVLFGVGAVLFNVVSHLNYIGELEYRRDWLRADYANWINYKTFLQYAPSFNDNIREVYATALERGICRPVIELPALTTSNTDTDNSDLLTFEKMATKSADASGEHLENEVFLTRRDFTKATPFIVLLPDNGSPLWVPMHRGRNAYRQLLSGGNLKKPEVWTRLFSDNLPVGSFTIGYQFDNSLTLTEHRLEVDADHTVNFR